MSDEVSWVFEVTLKPGVVGDFRTLAKEMVAANRSAEPDTLGYHIFITEDGSRVHFYERYRDSAAAILHVGRFGQNFAARVLDLANVTRFEIYGTPSDELRRTVADFGATYLIPVAGFER